MEDQMIFVRFQTGSPFNLRYDRSTKTIGDFKKLVEKETGVASEDQIFIWHGFPLKDDDDCMFEEFLKQTIMIINTSSPSSQL